MGTLNKKEVIEKFCRISTLVNEKIFDFKIPSDCFCDKYDFEYFRFDEKIIDFISEAVNEKINSRKDGKVSR